MFSKLFFCLIFLTALTPLYSQEPLAQQLKSIIENKMDKQITIINDDAKNVINLFGDDYFDVITCNPPYFDTNNSLFENVNSVKAIARHEKLLNLDDIFTISKRVLKTNGRLAMVHRTERLTQILDIASKYGFMAKKIRFILKRIGIVI